MGSVFFSAGGGGGGERESLKLFCKLLRTVATIPGHSNCKKKKRKRIKAKIFLFHCSCLEMSPFLACSYSPKHACSYKENIRQTLQWKIELPSTPSREDAAVC